MKQGVDTLARLSTAQAGTQRAQVPAGVYLKFLGRYALLIVAAYAILRAFKPPVASLLAGFFSRHCRGSGGNGGAAFPCEPASQTRVPERVEMGEGLPWVTILLNRLLGKPVGALLNALHIHPANPEFPIPNHVAFEVVVFALAAVFFLWLRARISVDRPGGTQQCMEALLTNSMGVGIRDLLDDNVGHDGRSMWRCLAASESSC